MKKTITLFIIIHLCAVSFAQKKAKIKGDKNVIEVSNELSDFKKIEILDDLKVNVTFGTSSSSYRIKTDSNLIEVIKFEVIDSILKVYTTNDIASKKKLEIDLNVKSFSEINLYNKSVLNQIGYFVTESDIQIMAKDNSKIKLDLKAKNINLNLSNNADGELLLEGDTLRVSLNDEIDVKGVLKSNYLDMKMNKDAEANFKGYNENMILTMIGAPILKSSELMNKRIEAKFSNNSYAYVNCVELISLYLEDKSKVYIYNAPKVEVVGLRGQAQIIKK